VSEAAAALSPGARPLRWPWAVVAGFAVLATYGSILVFQRLESAPGGGTTVSGEVRAHATVVACPPDSTPIASPPEASQEEVSAGGLR
jgi:hypothetical protein